MKPAHAQRLAALFSELSLLDELTVNRPALGGLTIDEVVSNAKKAEGWEACVSFLRNMTAPEEKEQTRPFVNTTKGFQ